MPKKKELKTRKLYIKENEDLVTQFKLKAATEGLSVNEGINQAIRQYLKSGGSKIKAQKDKRLALLLPESLYNKLSEQAKVEGQSITKVIQKAMENYITKG